MLIKPIPKSFLLHTVTVISGIETDMFNEETNSSEITIKNVRVEPCSKLSVGRDNLKIKLDTVLFYDIKSSIPKHEFTADEKIDFMGERYNIASIKKLYDGKKLHHLEIGLTL